LHAAYALDGDVTRDGDVVRVSVRLDDVNAHQTVWAQTFDRDAARIAGLRLEVATAAVNVLHCAYEQRAEIARIGKAPLALLLRVCSMTNTTRNDQEYFQLTRQLAEAAPRSSLAQGLLALGYYSMADISPAPLQPQLYARAGIAADAALRLNPHESIAATIKVALLSAHQTRIERERTFLQYLRLSPDGTFLNTQYAELLRATGRTEEAVAYIERAYALDPLSPYVAGLLGWMRAVAGRSNEAKELLDSMAVRWPEAVQDVGWARFRTSVWFGSKAEALRILEDSGTLFNSAERACWRTAIDGMSTVNAAARTRAASEVRRCHQLDPSQTFQILASLGDTDGAFATADAIISAQRDQTFTGIFFVPAAAAVRRDPRFMPLMHRAGLTDYWLQSGHWPDFCADPQLPYNCRAEAARLSANR
jgi:tetratricopeptide (TPR) repeat protein